MSVLTIYNQGTFQSSQKPKLDREVVFQFANADGGQPYVDKIVNEGVGSSGDPEKLRHNFSLAPGANKLSHTATQSSGSNPLVRAFNAMTGKGMKEGVENTVEFIRFLNLNNKRPNIINMLGFSRGAVTSLRIANALYQSKDQLVRNIPINIFSLDPVAGAGSNTTKDLEGSALTPNVKYYCATLAKNEKMRFFKPTAGDRLDTGVTKVWVIPMPGDHEASAQSDNKSGLLVHNLAIRFMAAWGSNIPAMTTRYRMSNRVAWSAYEKLMVGAETVHKTNRLFKVLGGGVAYNRSSEIAAHSDGETFFPNSHARLLFAKIFPITYSAYFDRYSNKSNGRYLDQVAREQNMGGMSMAMRGKLLAYQEASVGTYFSNIRAHAEMARVCRLID